MARMLSAMLLPVSALASVADTTTTTPSSAAMAHAEMPLKAANFAAITDYTGDMPVTGSFRVGRAQTGTLVLFYDLAGVDKVGCVASATPTGVEDECGIHIHEGHSCDNVGAHYYDAELADPWATVKYTSSDDGSAVGRNVHVTTGTSLADLVNRTVVVYDATGLPAACAKLSQINETGSAIVPSLSKLSDYHGGLVIKGGVEIAQDGTGMGGAQILRFDLQGADPECTADFLATSEACDIHINSATSCDNFSSSSTHFFDSTLADPWVSIKYVVGANGNATGVTVPAVTGKDLSSVIGKTVLVCDSTGAHVACGVIKAKTSTDGSASVVGLAGSGPSPRWWVLAASAALVRAVF